MSYRSNRVGATSNLPIDLAALVLIALLVAYVVSPALTLGALAVYAIVLSCRGEKLPAAGIERVGGIVQGFDREGRQLGKVDLDQPWSIRYVARSGAKTIFRLEQDGQQIDFSNQTPEGVELCKVLGVDPLPGPSERHF